jgi:RecA-family ATPase
VIAEIGRAKRYHPEPAAMFVSPEQFVASVPDAIDWLVEGVIQRGDNGVIAADPKGSKSVVTIDLAVAMALGKPWLDFYIPRRVRTALISREDNDSTTGRRMRRVVEGRDSTMGDLRDWLYLNSRRQTKELMLDNEEHYSDLLFNLKQFRPEFVILDVFNVLHDSEENDQQEMKNILRKVTQLSSEVGCSVMLVHHFRKGGEEDSLTQRLRGSSAIAGWCEWVIGLRLLDRDLKVREMEFEYKVCEAPKSLYYRLNDTPSGALTVNRIAYDPPTRKGKLGGK